MPEIVVHPALIDLDGDGSERLLARMVHAIGMKYLPLGLCYPGFTCDFMRRIREDALHYARFPTMLVIAETSEQSNVRIAETLVIEHLRKIGRLANIESGGQGRPTERREYLYICLPTPWVGEAPPMTPARMRALARFLAAGVNSTPRRRGDHHVW